MPANLADRPATLGLPAGKQAALAHGGIELTFSGKPRNEDVKV